MDLQEFCKQRPCLYHLTDKSNLRFILNSKVLLSTSEIAHMAFTKQEAKNFLQSKREEHVLLSVKGLEYKIRDQKPILLKVLTRSLSKEINTAEFIELLNNHIFWWPTLDRLNRHYKRYEDEEPVILRVSSEDLLDLNKNVELCHLNSGATRCHPSYGGNAPTRGRESFLSAKNYEKDIASVAEVTFVGRCILPQSVWLSNNPHGKWKLV